MIKSQWKRVFAFVRQTFFNGYIRVIIPQSFRQIFLSLIFSHILWIFVFQIESSSVQIICFFRVWPKFLPTNSAGKIVVMLREKMIYSWMLWSDAEDMASIALPQRPSLLAIICVTERSILRRIERKILAKLRQKFQMFL